VRDPAEAERLYQDALTIDKGLAAADPDNADHQQDLAISYDRLADLAAVRDPAEAERLYQDALAVWQRLAEGDPDNIDYQRGLSMSYDKLGGLVAVRDPAEAERLYQDALAIRQRLAAADPDNTDYHHDLANSYGCSSRAVTSRVSLFSLGRSGGCDCGRLGPGVWSAAVGWDCG